LTNYSYGHSIIEFDKYFYSVINGTLHRFDVSLFPEKLELSSLETVQRLPFGLIYYGIGITEGGILAIYGGEVESTFMRTPRHRSFKSYSDLWILNMFMLNDFVNIEWNSGGGGWSKILSLGGEVLCVLCPNMDSQMMLINFKEMKSYPLEIKNPIERMERTAFGISGIGGKNFIIIGGFNQFNNEVKDISPILMVYQLSFSSHKQSKILETTFAAFGGAFLFIFVSYILRKSWNTKRSLVPKPTLEGLPKGYTQEAEEALSNSRSFVIEKIQNLHQDPDFTGTLALPNESELSIPLYKKYTLGKDVAILKQIASGGFGNVSIGKIMNNEICEKFNEGSIECVIKTMKTVTYEKMFLQEVGIHEVFKNIKYFSKLICFSQDPYSIVLKYYNYGPLSKFLFPSSETNIPVAYSFQAILWLAFRLTWAFEFMHNKFFIHNDIKPDNILLSGDDEEPFFPVITDFGIAHVLDSALVIKGFIVSNVHGASLHYSAPEVLKAICERPSNYKTDVYSIGIVLYEMFMRQKAWPSFDRIKVIKGEIPNMSVEILMENLKDISIDDASRIFSIVKRCLSNNPEQRPLMREVHGLICDLKQ
jgi:hypothetical protein